MLLGRVVEDLLKLPLTGYGAVGCIYVIPRPIRSSCIVVIVLVNPISGR